MKYQPYPSQQVAIDDAVLFLSTAQRGAKKLYAAPTGFGKSVVQLGVRERLSGLGIVTPREEIVDGLMDKLGVSGDPMDYGIFTPIKLRNRLLSGVVQPPPYLIFDEGHHHTAETWQQLDLLTGLCPSVAYTASPYRGTPSGTAEFRSHWGDPVWIITYEESVKEGYVKMPDFTMLPLVDDDVVEVKGGEFDVTSIDAATVDRLGDLADHAKVWYSGEWDLATVFACPTSSCCVRLQQELARRGMPTGVVKADTSRQDRLEIFRATEQRAIALIHINVVSEGVDLKLRRLVDLAPTLSPVKWVQQLGRITRPWDRTPQYVCTNRNLLRHAYILEGVVPPSAVSEAFASFPQSDRANVRVLGLEAVGRFKPATVKLASGLIVHMYSLSAPVGTAVVEYTCLVHPLQEPVWAVKANTVKDGQRTYGSWTRCDPPNDVRGFSSVPPRALSDKQKAWWDRSAANFGLDPRQDVDRKNFPVLPVLADLGVRLT